MTEFAAISPEHHAQKVWKNVTDYAFAAEQTVIPLVGAELSKTISAMPTGFIKQEAGYELVAITSLQAGMNLYVAPDGKWIGTYIPSALRGYPFKLAQQASAENLILCINEPTCRAGALGRVARSDTGAAGDCQVRSRSGRLLPCRG